MHRRHYKHISKYFGWEFVELCDWKGQNDGAKRGRTKYRKKLRRIAKKKEKTELLKQYNKLFT